MHVSMQQHTHQHHHHYHLQQRQQEGIEYMGTTPVLGAVHVAPLVKQRSERAGLVVSYNIYDRPPVVIKGDRGLLSWLPQIASPGVASLLPCAA